MAYKAIFDYLRRNLPTLKPHYLYTFYDINLMKAASEMFRDLEDIKIQGCLFHYSQVSYLTFLSTFMKIFLLKCHTQTHRSILMHF